MTVPAPPHIQSSTVDVPTTLQIPTIPEGERSSDPPVCMHGRSTLRRTVMRKDSPNLGRGFYVCNAPTARCAFFRWADEVDQYSDITLRSPLTASEVQRATAQVELEEQLEAWNGVQQGTDRWHRLRACRVSEGLLLLYHPSRIRLPPTLEAHTEPTRIVPRMTCCVTSSGPPTWIPWPCATAV